MAKPTSMSVRSRQTPFTASICPRCAGEAKISEKHLVCSSCTDALTKEAQAWQERDYLARYLSTREDDTDKTTVRLRASALAQGVDWTHPPEPIAFADRMAALMAPYRPQLDLFATEQAS